MPIDMLKTNGEASHTLHEVEPILRQRTKPLAKPVIGSGKLTPLQINLTPKPAPNCDLCRRDAVPHEGPQVKTPLA